MGCCNLNISSQNKKLWGDGGEIIQFIAIVHSYHFFFLSSLNQDEER
jgi:hypothetical protein